MSSCGKPTVLNIACLTECRQRGEDIANPLAFGVFEPGGDLFERERLVASFCC
ncbi:MAG: hypothetical protein KDJ99_30535 [Candidatus Competibacteraceae bacterium]|nr:hypothetical protein [Candidatus Competibacteraceae bacterium]